MSMIPQMAADICAQANALDDVRLRFFLDWLRAHHRTEDPIQARDLPILLHAWLGSLTPEGAQWEYQLLLVEITWWRNLSEARFFHILQGEKSR